MSTNVVGFIPPDDNWKKMKKIWDTCKEMNIEPPIEVLDFFDGSQPDDNGKEVGLPIDKWNDDMSRSGFELEIDKIPENVKIIRFYNSW